MATTDHCRRIAPLLRAALDEPLPPDDARRVAEHLAVCPACRHLDAQYRASARALADHYHRVPGLPLRAGAWGALAAPPARSRSGNWLAPALGTAVACLAALLIISAFLARGGNAPAPTPQAGGPPAVNCGATPASYAPTPSTDPAGARATATAAAKDPIAVVEDPCTPPVPGLITLEQAGAAVRAFLGEPDATFSGRYIRVVTGRSPQGFAFYWIGLQREGPRGTTEVFDMDAVSGEVVVANFDSSIEPATPTTGQPIDEAEAQSRASAFAQAHAPDFDALALRGTTRAELNSSVTFSWQLRVGADGAWLPTMVQVSVSLRTGEIRLYSRRAMPYAGPTTPQVTAEEARARAVAAVSGDRQYANATAGTPVL